MGISLIEFIPSTRDPDLYRGKNSTPFIKARDVDDLRSNIRVCGNSNKDTCQYTRVSVEVRLLFKTPLEATITIRKNQNG